MEKFKTMISNSDFSSVFDSTAVNESYDNFISIYQHAYEIAFPLKRSSAKSKYIKRQPWITYGLLVSSRQKIKLMKKQLNNPNIENKLKYKNYLSLFNKLCRIAKRNYYTDKLSNFATDTKQTWKIFYDAIKLSKKNNSLPSSFIINTLETETHSGQF